MMNQASNTGSNVGMNESARTPGSTVIVVDDDAAVRNSLKFSLEIEGFTVRVFSDGAALLRAPDIGECACLVIDQSMPGISGLETVRQLRIMSITVPVILITGRPTAALSASATSAGINVVEKPLFGNALIEGIREVIKH